jgi:hypothetical protein
MNYDEMLSKMSLRYFNGQLYQEPPPEIQEVVPQSYIHNKYFSQPQTPTIYKPKTKEEYIQLVQYQMVLRRKIQEEQKRKRKLLISATNGSIVQVGTSNSLFRLK